METAYRREYDRLKEARGDRFEKNRENEKQKNG